MPSLEDIFVSLLAKIVVFFINHDPTSKIEDAIDFDRSIEPVYIDGETNPAVFFWQMLWHLQWKEQSALDTKRAAIEKQRLEAIASKLPKVIVTGPLPHICPFPCAPGVQCTGTPSSIVTPIIAWYMHRQKRDEHVPGTFYHTKENIIITPLPIDKEDMRHYIEFKEARGMAGVSFTDIIFGNSKFVMMNGPDDTPTSALSAKRMKVIVSGVSGIPESCHTFDIRCDHGSIRRFFLAFEVCTRIALSICRTGVNRTVLWQRLCNLRLIGLYSAAPSSEGQERRESGTTVTFYPHFGEHFE